MIDFNRVSLCGRVSSDKEDIANDDEDGDIENSSEDYIALNSRPPHKNIENMVRQLIFRI